MVTVRQTWRASLWRGRRPRRGGRGAAAQRENVLVCAGSGAPSPAQRRHGGQRLYIQSSAERGEEAALVRDSGGKKRKPGLLDTTFLNVRICC